MNETEQNTPAENVGVFDNIKGARSKDPDEVQEVASDTEEQPTEAPKPSPDVDGGTKIRQNERIAQLERQLGELDGVAQLGIAIIQDPEGKKLAERWQKGEAMFDNGAPSAQKPAEGTREAGLSREQLHAELNSREAAARQIGELNDLMEEKDPEFKKIRRNQEYAGRLDACLAAVWNGSLPEDPEVSGWADRGMAKNYTAMKEARDWYVKKNPKVLEAAKEAGKLEANARNEAALAGEISSASGTTESSGEEPPKTEAEQMIDRMLNASGVGRSFNTVGKR